MDEKQKNLFILFGEWWANRSHRTSNVTPDVARWFPTPGNIMFTLLIAAFLIVTQSVWARGLANASTNSASTISYQGRLADTSGNPVTGLQNMEFRLYASPAGGTPLWEEFWTGGNAVQVSDGLFNVMLGSLNSNLTSVVQGQTQLYLGITVGTDSEMAPRVQLGSVPFSMQALTVPDGSINTSKIADGAVTLNKLGPDIELVPPDGSVTNQKIALNRFYIGTTVPDHTPIGTDYIVLGETTYSSSYDASLLISINYTGYGGRVIIQVKDANTNTFLCGMNHNNSTTATSSITCMADVPAGERTLQFVARSASSSSSPVVRTDSHVLIVPFAQP